MKRVKWSLVMYCLLGFITLTGIAMLMGLVSEKSAKQLCTKLVVIVEGKETFIDQDDIVRLIRAKYGVVEGKEISLIPTQRIEETIEKLPYVSYATVHTDINGLMRVTVQQREVVLRVINANGLEYYVDTENKKVPVTLKYVPHVLVANGNIEEGYDKALEPVRYDLVKDLVKIVKHIGGDVFWENQVVQLYVDDKKDIELIPRVGKEELVLGNADSLAYKLKRLEIYYKNILPRVGTEAYTRVNVKYGGQIICERKSGWYMDSLQMKLNIRN